MDDYNFNFSNKFWNECKYSLSIQSFPEILEQSV